MPKIEGGYILLQRAALSAFNDQICSKNISLSKARAVLGLIEMKAIRMAAESLKPKFKQGKVIPNYSVLELSKITGLKGSKKYLKEMILADELLNKKGRLIPVPRRILRFLAKSEKRSSLIVTLSYIERGLSLDKGRVKNAGTYKASQISERTGLTVRSVRSVRADLLRSGILTPDTTRYQRKLNRDGAYFTVNLSWAEQKVDRCKIISPLMVKNRSQISPPYRNKNLPKGIRNQKPQEQASNRSGFYIKKSGEGNKPKIFDVKKEDLESFGRTEALYFQAIKAGLIENSESSAINFLAAAVRAKSVEGDSVKVFMGIVRKKLWANITMADEDRALLALRKYRGNNPDRFRLKRQGRL